MFFVQCLLQEGSAAAMAPLRTAHLEYIAEHRDGLAFGGLVQQGEGPPSQICYFLKLSQKEAAEEFVHGDPYFSLYREVEILPFVQRVPRPPPLG